MVRKILLVFVAVFIVFNISLTLAGPSYQYNFYIIPGPGNTTVVFTDTSTYRVDYDSRYGVVTQPIIAVYEITVNNSLSTDLTDFQLEIRLDSDNFSDWDVNTSDVYFVDEFGNPLYFYIEQWDQVNHHAIIWVKLDYIKANSLLTLYMFISSVNPYVRYNDPSKVFLFFDDFEDQAVGSTDSKWDEGSRPLVVDDNGNKVGEIKAGSYVAVKTLSEPLNGIVVVFKYKIVSKGTYGPRAIVRVNSAANTDNFYFVKNEYDYWLGKYTGSWVKLASDGNTYSMGVWYVDNYIKVGNGRIEAKLGASTVLSANDNSYTSFISVKFGTWDTGNVYYIDDVGIGKYDPRVVVTSIVKLFVNSAGQDRLDNSHGLFAIMASRFKSWFAIGDSSTYHVRIVYDTGFTFWVGSDQVGGGDIGYDNDYFLYRIFYDGAWHFRIDDLYTGQYLYKDTSDTGVYAFNETYINMPYLFYLVFDDYDTNDYVIIHIRAPPNYYVDNVSVTNAFAEYQNNNIYIYYQGNDAYIKLGYVNTWTSYYPLIVRFNLYVGDLPDRNTYDANRDPYSDEPVQSSGQSSSSSSSSLSSGGSVWGYSSSGTVSNSTLYIPGYGKFPAFLLNGMLFLAVLLPGILLYKRYWLFPTLLGLLVLARIGYSFFYIPVVLFTIFVSMMYLRQYIQEEYAFLVGLILAFFMNIFIVSGNQQYAPSPPGNPLDVPGYLNDLLVKAITFNYLQYPFNMIMTTFFLSLVIFGVIRLVIRIIRGV